MFPYEINPHHIFIIHNGIRLNLYLQPDLDELELFGKCIEVRKYYQ